MKSIQKSKPTKPNSLLKSHSDESPNTSSHTARLPTLSISVYYLAVVLAREGYTEVK